MSARDVDNIYKVPLVFRAEGADDLVLDHFGIEAEPPDLSEWEALVRARRRRDPARSASRSSASTSSSPTPTSRSSRRSIHGGYHHGVNVTVDLLDSEELDEDALMAVRRRPDPGRLRRARDRGQGRRASGSPARTGSRSSASASGCRSRSSSSRATWPAWTGANSAEFDPETPYPVIDLLPEQKEVTEMGGTMRLGADPVKLHDGTRAREIYGGDAVIYQRHRHRYEVNNMLRRRLEDEGLVASGTSPDERLVEVIELPEHPFFVASQFHPEFKSRPNRPEPLFRDFVGAAAKRAAERGDSTERPGRRAGSRGGDPGQSHQLTCSVSDAGNEEIVRRVWDRWNTGERDLDPELTDPQIEIDSPMTRTVWTGYEGVTRWMAEIDEQFAAWKLAIDELRTLDDGRVLVLGAVRAHGRKSGIVLDEPMAWVVELRDGRILRIENNLGAEAVEGTLAALAGQLPDVPCMHLTVVH